MEMKNVFCQHFVMGGYYIYLETIQLKTGDSVKKVNDGNEKCFNEKLQVLFPYVKN